MVGIRLFPFGRLGLFSGAFAVSFREGMFQGSTDGQNPKPALNALDGEKNTPHCILLLGKKHILKTKRTQQKMSKDVFVGLYFLIVKAKAGCDDQYYMVSVWQLGNL